MFDILHQNNGLASYSIDTFTVIYLSEIESNFTLKLNLPTVFVISAPKYTSKNIYNFKTDLGLKLYMTL